MQPQLRRQAHARWVFEVLALDCADLRDLPLERRKRELKTLLKHAPAWRSTTMWSGTGRRAGQPMGLEGIVSKRASSLYAWGRSPHWLKAKNPESPAARREVFEDWGRNGHD